MALPFTAPTTFFELGEVPTSLVEVTAATIRVLSVYFANTTDAPITVSIFNSAGVTFLDEMKIPPHVPVPNSLPYIKLVGFKWQASGAGLNAIVEGY